MTDAITRRALNGKRKKGDTTYRYGFELHLPNVETGEITILRFTGSFDRRKLRRMIRRSLVSSVTTEQIDFMIDNFGTRLRLANIDMLTALETDDAED